MWFSGLRGAIAYALSLHLEFKEETRKVLVTTTLVVVLFTTIILGGGTLPLMKFLGTTCPCASRGCKVAGCQTFFIFKKLYFSFYVSYFHMKTAPPMNTFDFFKY